MMAAPITITGATLAPGAPVVLFPTRIHGGGVEAQQGWEYDVTPDGRFLINTELDSAPRQSRCSRTGIPRRRSSPRAADKSPLVA
jgi:hypothetical protein